MMTIEMIIGCRLSGPSLNCDILFKKMKYYTQYVPSLGFQLEATFPMNSIFQVVICVI